MSDKEFRFVREYLIDLNATAAGKRAGFGKGAGQSGHRILRRDYVARAVDAAMASEAGATRTRIIDELALMAFANAGDYFEWGPGGVTVKASADLTDEQRAVVVEVAETITKDGGGKIVVKLADKQAALEKLGRVFGMFKDRVEHTGKDGGPVKVEDVSAVDLAKAMAFTFAKAAKEQSGKGV